METMEIVFLPMQDVLEDVAVVVVVAADDDDVEGWTMCVSIT